uniref:Uncharacterized protein n=2 Tax=Phlebotomus papatasi TaxID=29031 RepID=A0A1B0DPL7_PHLPP
MSSGQGGVIINEVVRAINEMRASDILWNTKHPQYNTPARQQAIEISAKRTDLSVERLSNLIRYVKKKYAEEVIRLQSDDPEVRERTCWKWYWKCHFLKEPQEYLPLYPDPHFMMQNYQVVPQKAIPVATPMSTEAVYIKTEHDSLESPPAPKVFILDPDSGINCKTEDNP